MSYMLYSHIGTNIHSDSLRYGMSRHAVALAAGINNKTAIVMFFLYYIVLSSYYFFFTIFLRSVQTIIVIFFRRSSDQAQIAFNNYYKFEQKTVVNG